MSELLSGFKVVKTSTERPFVTVNKRMMTFSAESMSLLNKATYVRVYVNPDEKKIALQPCRKEDEDAIHFFRESKGKYHSMARWTGGEVHELAKSFIPADALKDGVRVLGTFYEEEQILVFDFTNYVPVIKRTR